MIEDRQGDIYETFARKPDNVEKLVRAAQDRLLEDGSHLFAKADAWAKAGEMTLDLPAAPGRKARQAVLSAPHSGRDARWQRQNRQTMPRRSAL